MTSKVFKFSFVYTGTTKHKVAPSVFHTHWMKAVQDAFGSEIVIINNKNQNVETVSTLKWTDPSIHAKQFKIHQKTFGSAERHTTTFFIVHRVFTNLSLSKIRSHHAVQKIMREFKFYITDHQWTENNWDTTRIGWITTINPTYYNREQAQVKFSELLHSKLLAKKVKIPMFRMSFVSPTAEKDGNTISTKAYAIEILSETSVHMLNVLKTLLSDVVTSFVPYSMRSKYPEAYIQAIKFQTQSMNATRVVILQNISEAMMFYLGPHICALAGTIDLLASPQVDENGRHTLLVEKEAFKSVRNLITQNLANWIIKHVSIDAQPKEEQFAGIARVKPIHDDGMSSGENSWMSASNASFMSMDLSAVRDSNYFNETINIERVFTYADITMPVARTNITSDATDATDEVTTEVASEITELESIQKLELERLVECHRLATEQANRIVEAQRLEIEQLKAQRQADITERINEKRLAQETVKAQDKATSDLQHETKAELHDLKNRMTEMMNTFKAVFSQSTSTPGKHKRPATDNDTDDNSQSDKRQNVRSTPGKKLFTDYMDHKDPASSQQELMDNAPTTPEKS
jgi:hypothetical protein